MPTVKRNDGAQFVVQSYREQLVPTKISLIKKGIRALAGQHGGNVCVFRQNTTGPFEVVFSRDTGFLLGEAIWKYFNRPNNLIFCEALPEKDNALLVIVRGGSVYLDLKIAYEDLIGELVSLTTTNEKYSICVYGDVPLVETKKSDAQFAFEKNQVSSFMRLKEPVFPKLTPDTSLQLQPLELALTSPYLKVKLSNSMIWIIFSVIILFLLGWYFFPAAEKPKISVRIAEQIINPYDAYNKALMTPDPAMQLREAVDIIVLMLKLPQWAATSLSYGGGQYSIKVQPTFGNDVDQLTDWARTNGFEVKTSDKGEMMLIIPSKIQGRALPRFIYDLSQLQRAFYIKMVTVLDRENINVVNSENLGKIKKLTVNVILKELSPAFFGLIGQVLTRFPMEINSMEIDNLQGLYSGTIQLTLWGN